VAWPSRDKLEHIKLVFELLLLLLLVPLVLYHLGKDPSGALMMGLNVK